MRKRREEQEGGREGRGWEVGGESTGRGRGRGEGRDGAEGRAKGGLWALFHTKYEN